MFQAGCCFDFVAKFLIKSTCCFLQRGNLYGIIPLRPRGTGDDGLDATNVVHLMILIDGQCVL